MPYNVESPLAAGLGAAGGYMAGVNEKKQRQQELARQAQLDAQAQADTAARLGLERSNQESTQAYRTAELGNQQTRLKIDQQNADREATATAAAAAEHAEQLRRQKLIDSFQGQGLKYPKGWETMKPEQKIAYLQVRLNAASKAGDTKTVSNTEAEMNRVATQAEADRRQAEQDKRDANIAAHDRALEAAANRRIDLHVSTGGGEGAANLAEREREFNLTHNKDGTPKRGVVVKPNIPQQRATDADAASRAISNGADPDKVRQHYAAKWNIPLSRAEEELPDE